MEALHASERQWETLRSPAQWSKMLLHPRPDRPTEPNAGFVRYEPGTMIYHADPHYEEELSTETGGVMLFVQYQGPTTGAQPIYDGRFNVVTRKPVSEER